MIGDGFIGDAAVNSIVAEDEEAYQLWLRDPSAGCGHIITLNYNGTSAVYPNWVNYALTLSDFPLAGARGVVKSVPEFTRSIGEDFTGAVSASIGNLVLDNLDGSLDQWPNLSFDGQLCRVRRGDPSWNDPDRFRILYDCIAEIVTGATREEITIRLRAIEHTANGPIQENLIASGSEINQPIPLAYGRVFNVEPRVIDAANQTYQWQDGPVANLFTARDGGIAFNTSAKTVSAVDAGTNTITTSTAHGFVNNTRVWGSDPLPAPLVQARNYWVIPAGLTTTAFRVSETRGGSEVDITGTTTGGTFLGYHWTADLTNGKIYLDSNTAGKLTLDGSVGSTLATLAAASYLPGILKAINVDTASLAKFAVTCPQTLGRYVRERTNRLDIASEIMSSLGAWYGYSRAGMLQMGRIESSYSSYDLAIGEDDIDHDSFKLDHMIPPRKQHRIGYQRNWTVQNDGSLFAGVSADDRALYSNENYVTPPVLGADEGSGGQEFHLLAEKPDVVKTLIYDSGDAVNEGVRRDALFYGWGEVIVFDVKKIGAEIDIGQVLNVTYPRYGFANAVNVPVVHVADHPTERKTTVKIFAALAAYAPGQL
jgi:hypothetical protein